MFSKNFVSRPGLTLVHFYRSKAFFFELWDKLDFGISKFHTLRPVPIGISKMKTCTRGMDVELALLKSSRSGR